MWDEQASSDLYEVLDLLSIKQMKLLGHLLDTEEKRIEQLQTARNVAHADRVRRRVEGHDLAPDAHRFDEMRLAHGGAKTPVIG